MITAPLVGCSVRPPKNGRKGEQWTLRLDLQEKDSSGCKKYIISHEKEANRDRWVECFWANEALSPRTRNLILNGSKAVVWQPWDAGTLCEEENPKPEHEPAQEPWTEREVLSCSWCNLRQSCSDLPQEPGTGQEVRPQASTPAAEHEVMVANNTFTI